MKEAVLAFGAIKTEAGAVMLPVDERATDPPEGRGPVMVTVHTATAPGPIVAGAQLKPLMAAAGATLTPPLAVVITNSAA